MWGGGGGASASACGNGMDLKHEVAYRGVIPAVKAEPGVSHPHNGHQLNGHVREWPGGGAGTPSPGPAPMTSVQPPPNGYSSPLSSGSYGPYSPNGKIGKLNLQ